MKIKATTKKGAKGSPAKKVITTEARPSSVKKSKTPSKPKGLVKKSAAIWKVDPDWKSFTVVAIGASAGGLEAITQFLQNLDPTTGMAFIYVQHLSPDHKSLLSAILSKVTKMKVQDVEDMDKMQPNNVYIIPYNKGIEVTDGHIKLVPRPVKQATLSIDILFTSLAETHKENVIGIILSGSGSDGTRGLREIKNSGGITFAQDDSAKFGSMPRSAIGERTVDFVLPPKAMADKLNWMSKHPLLLRKGDRLTHEDEIENEDPHLKTILQLLFEHKSVDFSCYKMNTIKRRLIRRTLFHKMQGLKEYVTLLQKSSKELDLLYEDMLINVTEFFRDSEAFQLLKTSVLPNLIKSIKADTPLRVWVTACSTGEEAYSVAMLLCELQDKIGKEFSFQIFASDLSAGAIAFARSGEYSKQQVENVSPQRIQRFFTRSKEKFRITKALRNVCIFAQHNVLRDPPFSKMDLITCRNMLIYLDPHAQRKAISVFHYALNEKGCLMLGKSETIGASTHYFTAKLYKKNKFYFKKKDSGAFKSFEETSPRWRDTVFKKVDFASGATKKVENGLTGQVGEAFDFYLLTHHAPASVVITGDMEIIRFRGPTSQFLQNPEGKASLNILKMVHHELVFELRNAIHQAVNSKQRVCKSGIEIRRDNGEGIVRTVNMEVSPLRSEGEGDLLIVVFSAQQHVELSDDPKKAGKAGGIRKDKRIAKLEGEIAAARFDMASITQDQEAANEELQSANEEIVSSNEELQSLNEELETSKEEIESTNEELVTTNQELQTRNQQVEELFAYYESILLTIHEPMLVLYSDLRIKSANRSFQVLVGLQEDEVVGTSLLKLGEGEWNIPGLLSLLEEVISRKKQFQNFETEINFNNGTKMALQLNAHRIMRKSLNHELIVLTISDVTQIKKLSDEILQKERRVNALQLETDKVILEKSNEINKDLEEARQIANEKTRIAEESVKSKQRFLANMSHEIRTPMNAIIGFTNVILKTNLSDAQKEYLNAIKVSGDALIVLVNDILDLAKVDAGKMTFEKNEFDLRESIASMLHLFKPKIEEKNLVLIINIDQAIPTMIIGDALRLRQIFLNLLSNAVKFTKSGKVTVSAQLLKEDQKELSIHFSVSDTGIGIQDERKDQIFNSFEQAGRDTARSYGGSGLGLAIFKQLVELQGGSVSMESREGEGSTFGFSLKFLKTVSTKKEKAPTVVHENVYQKAATGKRLRVLMVEDVALNQLLLKIILTDFGFDFDIANNGKIALDYLNGYSYDVILMDLQMPVMNGFEATEHIRNVIKSHIPIIALSADVTSIDVEKCLAAGMNDYVSKPIDEKLLFKKITDQVNLFRARPIDL